MHNLFPHSLNRKQSRLCCYHNPSPQLQVVRSSNLSDWLFERVVFPGERLLFEAPPEMRVDIYISDRSTEKLTAQICCDRLRVKASPSSERSPHSWFSNRFIASAGLHSSL